MNLHRNWYKKIGSHLSKFIKKEGRQLTNMGFAALFIKIYNLTLELVRKIPISLIKFYEKVGLPAH